jgi:anti-sigma28 factor (negative regulator of flagellin synthesis)
MKIDRNLNIDSLLPASKKANVEKTSKEKASDRTGQAAGTAERHEVSELARRMSAAKEVMDSLPDIRADQVAQARSRLLKGYYDTPEAREALVSKLAAILKDTGA